MLTAHCLSFSTDTKAEKIPSTKTEKEVAKRTDCDAFLGTWENNEVSWLLIGENGDYYEPPGNITLTIEKPRSSRECIFMGSMEWYSVWPEWTENHTEILTGTSIPGSGAANLIEVSRKGGGDAYMTHNMILSEDKKSVIWQSLGGQPNAQVNLPENPQGMNYAVSQVVTLYKVID